MGCAFLSDEVPLPLSPSFHFQILPSRPLSSLYLVRVGEGSGVGRTHRGSYKISRFPESWVPPAARVQMAVHRNWEVRTPVSCCVTPQGPLTALGPHFPITQ